MVELWQPVTRWDEKMIDAANYHIKHPEMWDVFIRIALDQINAGILNGSFYLIREYARFNIYIEYTKGKEFKITNDIVPFYARWFEQMYPQHSGWLKTSTQPSMYLPAKCNSNVTPEDIANRIIEYIEYGYLKTNLNDGVINLLNRGK